MGLRITPGDAGGGELGDDKRRSRFPEGMTERKAKAKDWWLSVECLSSVLWDGLGLELLCAY